MRKLRKKTAAAKPADRRHSGIVPTFDVVVLHKLEEFAFTHDGVRQIQTRKLDLLRVIDAELIEEPVVKGTVVFKL